MPNKLDCFCRCRFTLRRGPPSPRQENPPGGDRWPSNTPPDSVPPPGSRDSHFLSAWPGHTVAPVPDSVAEPSSPPPSGYDRKLDANDPLIIRNGLVAGP